ncbi:cobalamin B12-binding domain-containing protein [Gymnodinialimonas ulvae]|uniref:cobalamin B12-binding domain-containing protein n=1 Tax=Gymnodinialimonas ulvae TaxID=3126504 RepID=UPI00309B33C8
MTTHTDKDSARHDPVDLRDADDELRLSGISDLAIFALAELASGRSTAELSDLAVAHFAKPHVTAMATAMADQSTQEAETLVSELLDAGVTVQDLCLQHFAPAARELGRLWEDDRLPFADVSLAASRMQAILRNLPRKRAHCLTNATRGAVFAATPGETHTLGVLMAADHFRRLDWDVGVLVGLDHDSLCRQVLADDRPILGLSCAGGHSFAALTRVVDEMRARRPELAIVVSGAVTQDLEAFAMLPECDGVIEDLEDAEAELDLILENMKSAVATHGGAVTA